MVFLALLLTAGTAVIAQETEIRWHKSNASGIALEIIPSRLTALRNEYCLSVERGWFWDLPAILRPYYDYEFHIELRTLYEKGKVYRRQWIFRDENGMARLTASGTLEFFTVPADEGAAVFYDNDDQKSDEGPAVIPAVLPEGDPAGTEAGEEATSARRNGFIEIRNSDGAIEKEIRFQDDSSQMEFCFFYNKNILVRAETLYRETPEEITDTPPSYVSGEPDPYDPAADEETDEDSEKVFEDNSAYTLLTTDYYRYSRYGSLRAVDRIIHGNIQGKSRITFPRIGPDVSYGDSFEIRGTVYYSEFLAGMVVPEGTLISYVFDTRGRITTETWKDPEGEVIGELLNTWSGDRLGSVLWKFRGEERLAEYEYDAGGNRITERNFKNGELERSVSAQGSRDVEEIYLNGKLILRAFYENGLKLSEERITPERTIR